MKFIHQLIWPLFVLAACTLANTNVSSTPTKPNLPNSINRLAYVTFAETTDINEYVVRVMTVALVLSRENPIEVRDFYLPNHYVPQVLRWSPDGTKLAVMGQQLSGGDADIFLIDTFDNSVRQITKDNSSILCAWSPREKDILMIAKELKPYLLNTTNGESVSLPYSEFSCQFGNRSDWAILTRDGDLFMLFDNDQQVKRITNTPDKEEVVTCLQK